MSALPAERRRRRSTDEVRALLLEAARRQFAARGYGSATTSGIAAGADVSERVLFRHFASKDALFEAAVTAPFAGFLADFANGWGELPVDVADPTTLIRRFVAELYELVRANLDLVNAVLAHPTDDHLMADQWGDLLATADRIVTAHGYQCDTAVATPIVVYAIVSAARHQRMLFPCESSAADEAPFRDRVVGVLADLAISYVVRPAP